MDEEAIWQSTSQLPVLMMASHKSSENKSHNKYVTPVNPPSIIITNNTYNYRH